MFMPPKTYDCNIKARKLSKSLLVMHFIVYGKENKKNTLRRFKMSNLPACKTTCQGDQTDFMS